MTTKNEDHCGVSAKPHHSRMDDGDRVIHNDDFIGEDGVLEPEDVDAIYNEQGYGG